MKAKEEIMRNKKVLEALQKKELEVVTTLLELLLLVFAKSEARSTMNAHEFINYEIEFYLHNLYIPMEEEIIGIFNGRNDAIENQFIKEAKIVQIGEVVVDELSFKDAKSALVALKQFLEQRPLDVTSLI